MPENIWGECKDCKWWQIEPEASVGNLTMGLCIDEKLQPLPFASLGEQRVQPFHARRTGQSKGSGEAPPRAEPTR